VHVDRVGSLQRTQACLFVDDRFVTRVTICAGDEGSGSDSNGVGVEVNHNPLPTAVAWFPNDVIDTQRNAVARINWMGSTADIDPDTQVQLGEDELALEHSRLSVSTSRGLRVRVGCVTITPVNEP
jgi:hypothetical protein